MGCMELAALAIVVIGTCMTVGCTFVPYWKVNDPEDTLRDNIYRHEGLWIKCQSLITGNWDCDDFNRFFLGLPSQLQAARGFSLVAIFLSVAAIVALCIGMDSIPCGIADKSSSKKIRIVAAILAFVAGVLFIAAVSWYANDVRIAHELATERSRYDTTESLNRFIFGGCLFAGWIAGCLLVIGGGVAACSSCGGDDGYDDSQPRYAYRPPVTSKPVGGGQEYI